MNYFTKSASADLDGKCVFAFGPPPRRRKEKKSMDAWLSLLHLSWAHFVLCVGKMRNVRAAKCSCSVNFSNLSRSPTLAAMDPEGGSNFNSGYSERGVKQYSDPTEENSTWWWIGRQSMVGLRRINLWNHRPTCFLNYINYKQLVFESLFVF